VSQTDRPRQAEIVFEDPSLLHRELGIQDIELGFAIKLVAHRANAQGLAPCQSIAAGELVNLGVGSLACARIEVACARIEAIDRAELHSALASSGPHRLRHAN